MSTEQGLVARGDGALFCARGGCLPALPGPYGVRSPAAHYSAAMGGSQLNHIRRTARPMALVSAAATLLGALLICLSPVAPHHSSHSASPPDVVQTAATAATAATYVYTCPYDKRGCGLLPLVEPAVLTAPPPDAPLPSGAQPPHFDPPAATGGLPRSGALPRAPDLHVLQVLRT